MSRPYLLAAMMAILAILPLSAHAAAYPTGFYAFLLKYTNQGTINSSVYYNQSVGQNTYIVMELSSGSYALINSTGGAYSFVLNNDTVYAAMQGFALTRFYPTNSTLSKLNSYMASYEQTAATNITMCITSTGLNRFTCTEANACQSCYSVPICKDFIVLYGSGNTTTYTSVSNLMGQAIENFSNNYNMLNSSYNSYNSILSSINTTNTYTTLSQLQSVVSRISNISTALPKNQLFPLPQGFSPSNLSSCYIGVPSSQPWYCNPIGFCPPISFNATDLYDIHALLTASLSTPISSGGIKAFSSNVTKEDYLMVAPQVVTGLKALIAEYSGRFNATSYNASALLFAYHNASLSGSLTALQGTYTQLANLNISRNATSYNATLTAQFANVTSLYATLHGQYSSIKDLATNNTAVIEARELEYQNEPAQLATLAYTQQSINDLLAVGINSSQYASVYAELKSVHNGLGSIGKPIYMGAFVKSVDGGILNSILSGSNAPVPSKLASAPFYVFLITLLIGILVIFAIYMVTYNRWNRKKKLHMHPGAKRAWLLLFVVLGAIAVLVSYATYTYAQQANSFLPIDGFAQQLASHSNAFIAYNGSAAYSNASIEQCVNAVQASLNSTGKSIKVITMQNYTCTGTGESPTCFDQLLSSGTPTIVVSEGQISSVVYRGLYGHALYASGQSVVGSSCYLSSVVKAQ